MDINELETYRLSDAVKFHDRLNPALWSAGEIMLPEVREKLLAIADDFREFLGIDVEVKDITVSGSNAAYTYTPNSDIDLHLVVDLPKADASDIYRELFDAKKYAYNDQNNFRIGGSDVELYVQNANEPHYSQGIYSIRDDQWRRVPSRRRPTVDDISVESKYQDLAQRIDAAIESGDLARMDALAAKIRDMRAAGLETTGEFGAENLAFKVLRNNGTLERLRDARRAAKDQVMSLAERRKKKSKKRTRYAYGGVFFPGYGYYGHSSSETAADSGSDGGGGESVRESSESQQDVILRFARSSSDFLGMEQQPRIRLRQDPVWSQRNSTFGRYDADAHSIELATAGRHMVDILRTLAHEMTHARQNEVTGLPADAGETGSQYEDSANAMAGRIMRHWAESEPELFQGVDLDEQAQAQHDQQPTAPGVLGALRTIQNIGRVARNLPTQAGAEEELGQELKNWLRRQGGQTDQSTTLPLPDIRQQQQSTTVDEQTTQRYTNEQYDAIAEKYARMYNVPIGLVRHVMQKETGNLPPDLRRGARSPKGAIGVMQLMPGTAAELGVNPLNPEQNIEGGVRYLSQQLDAFDGNHQLAMMAYNWGPGNVRQWRRKGSNPRLLPSETRNYIAGYGPAPRSRVARAPSTAPRAAAPPPPASVPRRAPAPPAQPTEQQRREELRRQELERIDRIQQQMFRQSPPQKRTFEDSPSVSESSGYIPTEKEKNDPRFSMALTQDIRPGETGRQANKLGLKTNSQGRPTLLMKKLNNLLEAFKLDEKCWDGYRRQGMKKKGDRMVPNCVPVSETPGDEISKIIKTPTLQLGDRVWSRDFQDWAEITELGRERARIRIRNREHDVLITDLRKGSRMVREDEELLEVEMNPGAYQRFLRSPEAAGIRAGFEAELIFRDTQSSPDGGESEPDYEADERTGGIQDIIDFFTGGDNGIGGQAARRLQSELTEQFFDWVRERFSDDYFDQNRFMRWAEENIWPENDDAFRNLARANLGDDATDEQVEAEAVALFRDEVEQDWDRSGDWYDRASEELYDEYAGDADENDWLDAQGLNYMTQVAEEYSLEWPYWTDGSGSGGSRDWQEIGNSLERVTGMPVRVSSGYHGAARREGQYIIEPDSSLDSDDSDDYGLEVVSPPLPLPEAVEQLRRIIDWANGPGAAYTNSSTGLHMGVSLPFKGGDVDPIKLILFMGDKNLLEMFGRESNTYARSAYERLESKIRSMKNAGPKQVAGIMDLMKNNLIELADRDLQRGVLGDKYVSVHPQDGYIEFRGPGGDYLAKSDEVDGVLENTMLRLAYAMSIAGRPDLYRKEYAKKLYKTLTAGDRENPFMRLFADYSAGTLSGEELKSQWADTVLAAERRDAEDDDVEDVPMGTPQEYEVYDRATGEVYTTFQARNDDEAVEQFSRHHQAPYAQKGLPVLRVKAPGRKGKESTSRRAELAKRVTRSTRDVGEQLWRVNHHSSQRWVTARSQAEAIAKAIQQDRMFDNPETRARIATDIEKQQWQLDQEARTLSQRDSDRDAAQIRAQLGAPQPAGGEPTGEWAIRDREDFLVTTIRPRDNSQRGAEIYAQNWIARSRPDLDASDITVTPLTVEREPIPGSTLDIQRQRQQAAQQSQGEFTGRWEIRDAQGRELHTFGGVGNSQLDANRFAAGWLGQVRPDLAGTEVEVVPVMR